MTGPKADEPPPEGARGDPGADEMAPGDEAPPERPSTGENVCPDCGGSGELEGSQCRTCGGSGTVVEAVGGG